MEKKKFTILHIYKNEHENQTAISAFYARLMV